MNNVVRTDTLSDDLVKRIAMDVGKDVVNHLKFVYADIMNNAPSTFEITIRNGIYNRIMCAVKHSDQGTIEELLVSGERHRKKMANFRRQETRRKNNESPEQ